MRSLCPKATVPAICSGSRVFSSPPLRIAERYYNNPPSLSEENAVRHTVDTSPLGLSQCLGDRAQVYIFPYFSVRKLPS